MVLATLILLTSCQNDSPTSKKENTAQSDIKKHSNLDSNNKKAYEKDITNHEVPEDFKEIDHMMPEPPFVPGNELAPVDQMDTIKLPKTKIPPEEIFMVVEKMPEFPGGPTKMMEYIKNHLQYPNEAKERNLEGKVYIKFVVNPDGSLTEFKILKTADVIFNQPSLAVLSNMPKWIPGEQGGKKVKVYTIIPFNYKL
jgi:TonB family protein